MTGTDTYPTKDVLEVIAKVAILIVAGLAIYGLVEFELAVILLLLLQPAA